MSKITNFFRSTKGKIILVILPAIILPLIMLLIPRKVTGVWAAVSTILSALTPLICLLIAYLILKRTASKAGALVEGTLKTNVTSSSTDAVVFRQMVSCSRLGVLSTIYTDVVMLKKSKVGGLFKSHGIYKYVGRIEGGIQHLEDCQFEVDHHSRNIQVDLPEPTITNHEIIKLEKFDEKSSSFCRIENSEVLYEVQQGKDKAERLLIEYGFMREVEKRAQEVISGMIAAMGYRDYDVQFSNYKNPIPLVESPKRDSTIPQEFPLQQEQEKASLSQENPWDTI